MRPINIPSGINEIIHCKYSLNERLAGIQANYRNLSDSGTPEVSIVIPAYNEEKNILFTLQSLTDNKTRRRIEIIVVNNNSIDNTEKLVTAAGIRCVNESRQGITSARNAGLNAAAGKYILNADADAIYPPDWIDKMIEPLESDKKVALTYGRFAFIPLGQTGRTSYFFYEHAADMLRYINKYWKEEAVNVYGFNSGFRRAEGLQVNGFNHPAGANEDGYLALKLREKGFGKLHYVTNIKALVWTSDRRIQIEGGFFKGVRKRLMKVFFPAAFVQVRTDL